MRPSLRECATEQRERYLAATRAEKGTLLEEGPRQTQGEDLGRGGPRLTMGFCYLRSEGQHLLLATTRYNLTSHRAYPSPRRT